jgi:hypothetical protein
MRNMNALIPRRFISAGLLACMLGSCSGETGETKHNTQTRTDLEEAIEPTADDIASRAIALTKSPRRLFGVLPLDESKDGMSKLFFSSLDKSGDVSTAIIDVGSTNGRLDPKKVYKIVVDQRRGCFLEENQDCLLETTDTIWAPTGKNGEWGAAVRNVEGSSHQEMDTFHGQAVSHAQDAVRSANIDFTLATSQYAPQHQEPSPSFES